jgi:hypothetical protein
VTTIGFRNPRPEDPLVQRSLRAVPSLGPVVTPTPTTTTPSLLPALPPADESSASVVPASGGWVRVGTVGLRSALSYLTVWAGVVFAALVLVLLGGYVVLAMLGVTGSVSRAMAVLMDEQVPASGVLPALQPGHVLPLAVLVSLLLAGLWLVSSVAAVLVHNAVSRLTGGLRVRIRPVGHRPRARHAVPLRAQR